MSKSAKIGFSIKISSETSEKLRSDNGVESEENLKEKDKGEEREEETSQGGITNKKPNVSIKSSIESSDNKQLHQGDSISDNVPSAQGTNTELEISEELNESKQAKPSKSQEESSSTSAQNTLGTGDGGMPSDYAQYIHYEEDVAVYTDPSTNVEYVWCATKNEWILKNDTPSQEPSDAPSNNVIYENGVATYADKDGTVFIWDSEKTAWFPKVDDDFLAQYQMSYGFVDNAESSKEHDENNESEKAEENPEMKGIKRKNPEPPKWFDISDEKNTSVYVSNLPLDITEEEFVDLMQKCGLVMRDLVTQKMKIKLYTKPNSKQLKGDGLCTYIKVESVELAENILDGYNFKNHRLQVQKAHFQMKGDFNPALKPKKQKRKEKEKLKKMQEKLFDWRPERFRGERSKHEKVVIIKNLFEPDLFDKEVHLILEYQQDLREECSKLGEVRKVMLYDRHPEGVAQVIMKEPEEADNVVKLLNGRWFGKRQLTAEIWDGKTKYKIEETDADMKKRLGTWEKFLEDKSEGSKKIVQGEKIEN